MIWKNPVWHHGRLTIHAKLDTWNIPFPRVHTGWNTPILVSGVKKHQILGPNWYLTCEIWACFYICLDKNFARFRQIFARHSPDFLKNDIYNNISFVNNYPYNRKNLCQIWCHLEIWKINDGYLKTEFDEFLLNFDLDLRPNPQISAKNFNLPISTNL